MELQIKLVARARFELTEWRDMLRCPRVGVAHIVADLAAATRPLFLEKRSPSFVKATGSPSRGSTAHPLRIGSVPDYDEDRYRERRPRGSRPNHRQQPNRAPAVPHAGLAAVGVFEHDLIKERAAEGIAMAKSAGAKLLAARYLMNAAAMAWRRLAATRYP